MFSKQTQMQIAVCRDLLKKGFQETAVREWRKQDGEGKKPKSFEVKS